MVRIYGVRITKRIVIHSLLVIVGLAMLIVGLVMINPPKVEGQDVLFEQVDSGVSQSPTIEAFETGGALLINSNEEYSEAFGAASGVDFGESSVIAVFMGERPTGGYSIEVTDVVETSGAIKVYATEYFPGESCIVTQAITYPYTIVEIPDTDKRVDLITNQEVVEC